MKGSTCCKTGRSGRHDDLGDLRVAIASSGLGHVARGIETWAAGMGDALRREGVDVTVFQGAGEPRDRWNRVVPAWKRTDPGLRACVRRLRRVGGWRFGFGSDYQAEQTSFALRLWREVRASYDLLHVQDPWVALILERLHQAGLSRPRVILAHGTEEEPEFLRHFSTLQHLAPAHSELLPSTPGRQRSFTVPNFVDTERFSPGDQLAARRSWELPAEGLVVLSVAALKRTHKRMDYVIREFEQFAASAPASATLVLAGARELETEAVIRLGRERLGDRVRFLEGVSQRAMPELYRAADLFVLGSEFEMMPIAVLEALASGLPVVCHATPVLSWMVGDGGIATDLSSPGGLAHPLRRLAADGAERRRLALAARRQALEHFSEPAVTRQVLEMYREVAQP
jgi:glycosyltransferase involved in cell wall biosynthesis